MKAPARLQTLVEEDLINSVVRRLMSGKEAKVRGPLHEFDDAEDRIPRGACGYQP